MKRFLSILLSAVMLMSLIPFSMFAVSAEEPETDSQGVVYTLSDDGTYYIVSGYNKIVPEVVIPAEYNGLPVKEIGEYAFFFCANLTSIKIPDSVTSIGNWAFYYCLSLTSIEIPDSVTSIGGRAFSLCDKLQYNEYENGKYLGNMNNPYIVLVGVVSTNITSFTIHNNTKFIADSSFYDCYSLISIEIPDSVTSIGKGVFSGCHALESITVSSQNTAYKSIDNCIIETANKKLVAGCKNSVIPTDSSVTSIGDEAFNYCSSLTSIKIPDSVTSIGESAFWYCTNLISIVIPDSVTSIGYEAFSFCESLTSIEIPDSVTNIGEGAFSHCESLINIIIPDSVTSIGKSTFWYCTTLTSIVIPNSVTSIGEGAFSSCKSLTSIEIPDSVTSVGEGAFIYCDGLTDIYCEADSQPNGWHDGWLGDCNATIHWGCDISSDDESSEPEVSEPETSEPETSEPEEETKPTLGNIDDDGDVDASDYILVKRAVLNTFNLTDEQKSLADIDKDTDVDATDYVLIKRIVLGTYTVK